MWGELEEPAQEQSAIALRPPPPSTTARAAAPSPAPPMWGALPDPSPSPHPADSSVSPSPHPSAASTPRAAHISPSASPPSTAPTASPSPPPFIPLPPPTPAERARKTLVRNRRLHYLLRTPSYFTSPDLELADPLLYDRLIRRYLSASEREALGKSRGWSGVLEADLQRAEAKIAAVAEAASGVSVEARAETAWGEVVSTKEEGEQLWRETMTLRFLDGGDGDVDYSVIDESEEWDDLVTRTRDEEEQWFDAETPTESTGDTGVLDY